jgi:GcrA cell cycle regulator
MGFHRRGRSRCAQALALSAAQTAVDVNEAKKTMHTAITDTGTTSPRATFPENTGRGSAGTEASNTTSNATSNTWTTSSTWTTERIDQLRHFVGAGLTCSQIAAEIGVTRNAVIGKIHRLGLSPGRPRGRQPSALAQRMRATRAAPALPRPPRSPLAQLLRAMTTSEGATVVRFPGTTDMPDVEGVQRCSLLELGAHGCRWPLSDPGKADFGFCGNESIAGVSYCAGHARLAYRLPSGRRA